jgi:hypothetical protein
LPGAYWEGASPFIAGEPGLITIVAPQRPGTYVVAPSCHGVQAPANVSLEDVIADPWAITTHSVFDVNQTEPGDAEVCICEESDQPLKKGPTCEQISPLGPADLVGWDRVLVTPPPNASFEVVARGVSAEKEGTVVVVGKHYGGTLPSLQVGCGCMAPIPPSSVSPLTYVIPKHPRVIGKVDLCLDEGVGYVGPLIVSGVDVSGVRAEGLKLIVPGSGLNARGDKIALAFLGIPCTQPEAVLSAASANDKKPSTTLLEFAAPEGRYKVCFCDSTSSGDCTKLYNFFEVAADLDFVQAEGLSCLTAQPQLLQPHCEAKTDIVPGVPVQKGKGANAKYVEAPPANYDYQSAS